MRLSPSFARTSEECALRARWLRIDQAPRAVPPADERLRYGTAAHAALERLFRGITDAGGEVDLAHAEATIEEALDAAIGEHGPFEPDRERTLRAAVVAYATGCGRVRARDVLGVEQLLRWRAAPDVPVVGFADRIDRAGPEHVRVVDYKTGRGRYPVEELHDSLQVRTYAVAAAERWSWARQVTVEFVQLDLGTTSSVGWSRTELVDVGRALAERYVVADRRVAGGPWLPDVGPWCSICEFVALCPAKGGTPVDGIWDPDLEAIRGAPPTLLDG